MKNYSWVKIDPTSFMKGRKKVINQPIYSKIQTVKILAAHMFYYDNMEANLRDPKDGSHLLTE